MIQGNTVYVRWYRDILLQGEVVENDRKDQLAGMVAVRIPIQGMRITALFYPQHVYQSEDEAKGISPIISPNPPKVATEEREISREIQKSTEIICEKIQDSSKNICSSPEHTEFSYPTKAPGVAIADMIKGHREMEIKEAVARVIDKFKAAHWDNARNHLRIDALDEFYRLWLKTHDHRNKQTVTCTEITLPSHKTEHKSHIVSDERMDQLKSQLKQSLKPQQKTVQLDLFS